MTLKVAISGFTNGKKINALLGSANAAGEVGTRKWYVDHSKGSCKEDNDREAKSWNNLYIR